MHNSGCPLLFAKVKLCVFVCAESFLQNVKAPEGSFPFSLHTCPPFLCLDTDMWRVIFPLSPHPHLQLFSHSLPALLRDPQ